MWRLRLKLKLSLAKEEERRKEAKEKREVVVKFVKEKLDAIATSSKKLEGKVTEMEDKIEWVRRTKDLESSAGTKGVILEQIEELSKQDKIFLEIIGRPE